MVQKCKLGQLENSPCRASSKRFFFVFFSNRGRRRQYEERDRPHLSYAVPEITVGLQPPLPIRPFGYGNVLPL